MDAIHYRVSPSLSIFGTERLFTYGSGDRAQFGQNLLVDQGQADLYGCAQVEPTQCFVARTNILMNASSLAFWSSVGWVASLADADPIDLSAPVGTQLHVAKVGDGYIASNQIALLGTQAWAWWGPTALGPFRPIGALWDANAPPLGPLHSNWFSYGGRVINTSAGAVGIYNINTFDNQGAQVAGLYGPHFVGLGDHVLDRNPFGYVDSATALPGAARVVGWSIDPDTVDPIQVRLLIDGQLGPLATANAPRPDVAAAFPGFGPNHGFDVQVPLPVGAHLVCANGVNVQSGLSNTFLGCTVASGAGPASGFVAVDPTRILDSRNGTGGYATPWGAGETRSLKVAGIGSVPADATAVVMNTTVTNPTGSGYVTVNPTGGLVPRASNLNFVAGLTIANLVTVQVGTGGKIDLTNLTGHTDLVADIVGYYRAGRGRPFHRGEPQSHPRLARRHRGLLDAVGPRPDPLADHRRGRWRPAGRHRGGDERDRHQPHHRQLAAGEPHRLATTAGLQPELQRRADHPQPGGDPPRQRRQGRPHQPRRPRRCHRRRRRLLHHRGGLELRPPVAHPHPRLAHGTGSYSTPWGPGQTLSLTIAGAGGVPPGATVVVMNVTVTNPTTGSWLRVSPTGTPPPLASNLNFSAGQTIPNLVVIRLGSGGKVDLTNLAGRVDVIADVVGYYTL